MKTKDLVQLKVNNLTFRMTKERYSKLIDKQKKVIAEFDRHNIILGNGETTRDNQIQFLIRLGIEIGKDFESITKDDLIIFLFSYLNSPVFKTLDS